MNATRTYEALIGYWNGACYETMERCALDAETLDAAIAEVQAMTWDESEDYDIEVTIEDEAGDAVHTEHFEHSVAQSRQEEMDDTWEDEGEFTTWHLGHKDGDWYTWTTNGGSRGAHDRMDGSGRWIESYDAPESAGLAEAHEWLTSRAGMDADEAMEAMADADPHRTKADYVAEIGEAVWRDGKYIGVYRVAGSLYTVDFDDCELVDAEAATEFVAERDEAAAEALSL